MYPPYQQPHRHLPYPMSTGPQPHPSRSSTEQLLPLPPTPSASESQHPRASGDYYDGGAGGEGKKRSDAGRSSKGGGSGGSADEGEAYVSRTLYICKLPPDFSEDAIRRACEPFGDIKGIMSYQSRQIAFVEYWDIRNAQAARNALRHLRIGGRHVEVQYSKTQNEKVKERNTGTLYVRPVTTERFFNDPNTLQQYKDLFQRFGDVKKVNTNRKRDAEKFVEFHDLRAAEAAQESLNDMDFNGVKLEVQFANAQSKTINKEGVETAPPPLKSSASAPFPVKSFSSSASSASRSSYRRDGSNPSYGPIRGAGFPESTPSSSSSSSSASSSAHPSSGSSSSLLFEHLPTRTTTTVGSSTSSSSTAPTTGFQSIQLHWEGKLGPSVMCGGTVLPPASNGFGQVGGSSW